MNVHTVHNCNLFLYFDAQFKNNYEFMPSVALKRKYVIYMTHFTLKQIWKVIKYETFYGKKVENICTFLSMKHFSPR